MQPSIFFDRAAGSRIVRTLAYGVIASSVAACADSIAPEKTILATSEAAQVSTQGRKIADEYIVVFNSDVSDVPGKANGLLKNGTGTLNRTYASAIKGFSAHMNANQAQAIANDPSVAYVEQDQEFDATDVQGGATWGLDRIDQSSLPLDGNYGYADNGAGVNVYIIDTGIRHTHSQFGGRVVPAYSAIADGYGADGCHWHGTHVAGTIGGSTVGVAKAATLYSVRVLDCNGSAPTSTIIAGIDWVTANRVLPAVANMSVSGGYSDAVNAAVQSSINSGVTYVVAAGNSVSDACNYSPSSTSAAITVAATTNTDVMASFSNWGACVDLFAPGNAIYSAWNTDDSSMGTASGTSMATPHVAGAAALYLQRNPSASPATVAAAIVGNATSGALTGSLGGSPNRILRVNGVGGTVIVSPPPPTTTTNHPPVASFNSSCSRSACTFVSTSTDDVGIASYSWSFGDGTVGSGPSVGHTYGARGTFVVTLTVRDGAGASASAQKSITIKQR